MTHLAVRALTVAMAERAVVEGVSIEVPTGSLCAMVGPSGAGKTTVLRAVAGLVRPTSGSIRLDDVSLDRTPTHRRGVAVCFQEPRLFPTMSVLDNVAYGLRIRRAARGARERAARELLDEVGLGHRAADPVQGLSGGEQQRVALARALCARPRVLLLDEPLASVDAPRRAELRELVHAVQRRHAITTLLVTHDLADATAIADSVAVLDGGRLVQHAPPAVVVDRPATPLVARLTGNPNVLWDPPDRGAAASDAWTIRPEHVALADDGEVVARVVAAEHRVTHVRLVLHGTLGELEAHVPTADPPAVGRTVHLHLAPERVWRFPIAPRSSAATLTANG